MGKKYTKAFWFFLGDAGVRIFGFLTTVLLARVLGAEAYGLITIAVAVLGLSNWFSDLGINTLGTRNLARPENKRTYFTSELFRIKIILGFFVLFSVSFIIWSTHFESLYTGLVIQLFLLSLIPQALLLDWYFNGTGNYKWITLSRLAQSVAYLLLVLLFVGETNLLRVPVFYLISVCLSAIILFTALPSLSILQGRYPAFSEAREIIISGLPLGLGSLFSQVVIFMPPLVIGFYFGIREAGLYGVAFKIILLFIIVDRFLIKQLLPDISELWYDNRTKLKKNLQKSLHWMLFTGCFFAIVLNAGSDFFIGMLFGEEYTESAQLLTILTMYLPIAFTNSIFTYGLISFNNDSAFLKCGLQGGIAAFFTILLVASIGTLSWVTWAVVIAELFILISFYNEFQKEMELDIFTPILKFLGLSALTLMLPFLGVITYPLTFILLPFLYILLVFLSRALDVNDLIWIRMKLFKSRE